MQAFGLFELNYASFLIVRMKLLKYYYDHKFLFFQIMRFTFSLYTFLSNIAE